MKKSNNKGFSLVELIVVVAIMAVLVGVLAPAYLSYVEKTRVQKDVSAISEVVTAIKTACADEEVATTLTTSNNTITLAGPNATISGNDDTLAGEVAKVVPKVTLSSKVFKAETVNISVTLDANYNTTITIKTNTALTGDAKTALEKIATLGTNSAS